MTQGCLCHQEAAIKNSGEAKPSFCAAAHQEHSSPVCIHSATSLTTSTLRDISPVAFVFLDSGLQAPALVRIIGLLGRELQFSWFKLR